MADKDPHVTGARIARRRHQLDLSQVELAKRIGVSPSTVANWERGVSYPLKKIGKVEQALGITLDDPAQNEPDVPTKAELNDLAANISQVLPPERAARMLAALDAEYPGVR